MIGYVAPKCGSANKKIVKIIINVSNWGNEYNASRYINGKIIGNFIKKNQSFY